jgi:gamma-glutamyltranspeptidase/glutathione hydrolase
VTDPRQTAWIIEKREAQATHGMVAAMSPLAAAAGLDMLRAGGNAVDAAVATAFAIGVVEPFMSGLGGVAVMVHYRAENGQTVVVDGSSTAPSAARVDRFELAADGQQAGMYGWPATRGDEQNTGYRSPIVPGTPACLLHSLARYGSGRLSRQQVMAPAIRLAEEGFPIDPYVAQTTAYAMRRLREFPETMRTLFHDDGTPLTPATLSRAADRLAQPNLARSLRMLADHGAEVFYQGEIGKRIVADLQANGGVISLEDFAGYQVREFSPGLVQTYRGHTLVGVPETSGCVTTYQMLNILENFDLAKLGYGAAEVAHLVAEASRQAFLDRFGHLADPARCQAPFEGVLSKAYAAELAASISLERADPEAAAGDPWRFQPRSAYSGRQPARAATSGGDGCTTHMTVVDSDRNVVSLTSTLGELFGCGVMAGGAGILLNNGMTWFDPRPGRVNSIEPGKRIFWAPSPTIVLKDDRPLIAIGAPGARRIVSAVAQSLVNLIDFGMGVQAAVSAARVHCEGPITQAEARLDPAVLDGLAARGHRLEVLQETSTSLSFARPNGIRIDPVTNHLTGGVNQFVPAWAMGY